MWHELFSQRPRWIQLRKQCFTLVGPPDGSVLLTRAAHCSDTTERRIGCLELVHNQVKSIDPQGNGRRDTPVWTAMRTAHCFVLRKVCVEAYSSFMGYNASLGDQDCLQLLRAEI